MRRFSGVALRCIKLKQYTGYSLQSKGISSLSPPQDSGDWLCSKETLIHSKEEAPYMEYPFAKLTHETVVQVLLNRQNNANRAFKFFLRVKDILGFQHNIQAYCILIHILTRAKKHGDAVSMLKHVIAENPNPSLVFDELKRSCFAYNSDPHVYDLLLMTYVEIGKVTDGLESLKHMVDHGIVPSSESRNTLLNALQKSGYIALASEVCFLMKGKGVPLSTFNYYVMISGCFKYGRPEMAEDIFNQMMEKGDRLGSVYFMTCIYRTMIHGFSRAGDIDKAESLLKEMRGLGFRPSQHTYTPLIDEHAKRGNMREAFRLKDEMVGENVPLNVVIYNILIHGLCKGGNLEDALRLVSEMVDRGIQLDEVTYNTLIKGCFRNGKSTEALRWYGQMVKKGLGAKKYTVNVMFRGLCEDGMLDEAIKFFSQVSEMVDGGVQPGEVTYRSLIKGCFRNGNMTKLIDGYVKEGRVDMALKLHDEMEEKGVVPNVLMYTILIDGLRKQGNMDRALELYVEMLVKNVVPDGVTYYVLVKGFCKVGKLEEANSLLKHMYQKGFYPSEQIDNALLKAHLKEGNLQEAFSIHAEMMERRLTPCDVIYENFS